MNADSRRASLAVEPSYLGIRDPAQRSSHKNEIAQRHHQGSRLSRLLSVDRDQVETVTTSLSITAKGPAPATRVSPDRSVIGSWPETPPGADPLPGQLDRWLAARGAELVAVRRHIHAHPELSGQEFETAALVARELAMAGLSPRFLPKGNGVICDIGEGDRVVALRADLDALPLPTGLVGVRSGPLTAAADVVEIRVSGPGGHTARPHMTADLVYALSRAVVEVPSILARRVDPRAGVSLMFGTLNAGTAANAIPIEGVAKGTVRVLSKDAWQDLPDLVPSLIRDVIAGTGAEVDITYIRGVPPVINDRMATAVVAGAAGAALGADRVVEADVSMGGEDFAFYLEQVPGAMVRLGTGIAGSVGNFDIHQSRFDVDERAIGHGIRVMAHTALAALSTGSL